MEIDGLLEKLCPIIKPLNNFEDDVKAHVVSLIARDALLLMNKVLLCESPIERIFGLYFQIAARETFFADNALLLIRPQHKITIGEKNYRVDFLIGAQIQGVWVNIIVECDGHEFHEVTKTQATRDKRRDRDLKAAGYEILHFTGSEINNKPYECALEVVEFMRGQARRLNEINKASGQ